MAGGGAQPAEGSAEVGVTIYGVGKGGRGCPDLAKNTRVSVPGSSTVWVRDVGNDTEHWEVFGRIPPQGGPQADRKETLEGGKGG